MRTPYINSYCQDMSSFGLNINLARVTPSVWRLSKRPDQLFVDTYQLATRALDSGEPYSELEEGGDA